MEIRRIVPNLNSNQIEKSKEFYTGLLGLTLAMDMDWILTFISPTNPTAQINICKTETIPDNTGVSFSIEMSDVDAVYAKAVELGYKIVYPLTNETWGVRRFFLEDPNGVMVNVMRHIPQQNDSLISKR